MRIDGTVYFSPFAIHRVLVDLFQGGRRRVAHAFHRVLVGHIQRQHNGCVIVPKVMKAAFQSELVPDLDEHLGDRNKKKGTRFYAKAATQGDQFAAARLGLCYILGRGVKQDKEKGIFLLREAAENGNEYAPIYLVMFGRLKYIPVEEVEIEQLEKKLKEEGYAVSISVEPVPIFKRKKNWVQIEYDHIEFFHDLDCEFDSEDDDTIPNPFDPLLNLGKRILKFLSRSSAKS